MKNSAPWDLSVGNDEGVEVEGERRKKERRKEGRKPKDIASHCFHNLSHSG